MTHPILILFLIAGMFSCQQSYDKKEHKNTDSPLPVLGRSLDGTPHFIPSFQLIDSYNKPYYSEDLHVYLTEFFYSACPSVCPKVASQMKRIYQQLKEKEGFSMLSITLDPEYDTPEKLNKYAQRFDLNTPSNWHFLSGDKDSIYKLATNDFYTPIKEIQGTEREIIHDGILVLVDCHGQIRSMYDGMDPSIVEQVIADVNRLLVSCSEE